MKKIKDIFAKDIDRSIRGVIKVGQDEEKYQQQELEEYVVTRELQRNFTNFFDAYDRSIDQATDDMGVWISGFFGSGKSHFLKILSYLLKNDLVNGKRAIDYFLEDGKFEDDHLAQAISKATSVPTDVALFNIDSKADANASNNANSIMQVFLRVFNEQLGYSSIPEVAEMERWLDKEGRLELFKQEFAKLNDKGKTWEELRSSYALMKTNIKTALINAKALNAEDADNYVDSLMRNKISMSPSDFAQLVKDYLDEKGNNQRFIFLADEVGQFIGDNNQKMLNLQTIVEELGQKCQGRAWVVVTSQKQMDQVTESFAKNRDDFSKIQGRFKTIITMSSANADEVIRKRLLAKDTNSAEILTDLFDQKEYSINNKIDFSDSIKREKYLDANDFVINYPFIPYQFDLLKETLTAVRKHGANGAHMADRERSMLATFQEATIKYEDCEVGKLIPYSAFFKGMKEFLSHDHEIVFDKAENDRYINPNNEDFPFNLQVLAVLFMVRYVDTFDSTIKNITTLMIDDVNQDVVSLEAKVKDALHVLLRQNLIQKKFDTYEFLTDSEQEINEAINAQEVDDKEVVRKIGLFLLNNKDIDPNYLYPNMSKQYLFKFGASIDDIYLNQHNTELKIEIYSPLELDAYDDKSFKTKVVAGNNIVVVLKDDDRYIENYRRIEKIRSYYNDASASADKAKQIILLNRVNEASEIEKKTQKEITNNLDSATIYALDTDLPAGTSFKARFEQAQKAVIDNSYRNLSYIDSVKDESDLLKVLENKDVSLAGTEENQKAIDAVMTFINTQASNLNNVTLASVIDRFGQIPYGYKELDVEWMVAKSFMSGKLKLYYNQAAITMSAAQENPKQVQKYLTGRGNSNHLTMKPVKEITERQRKDVREFVQDVLEMQFNISSEESSETWSEEVKAKTERLYNKLMALAKKTYGFGKHYPGNDILQDGVDYLKPIIDYVDSERVFQYISNKLDDMLDWRDELDEKAILEFYGDIQADSTPKQDIWNRSKDYLSRYSNAKAFILNGELETVVQAMEENTDSDDFNRSIPKLRDLNQKFSMLFNDEIEKVFNEYKKNLEPARAKLLSIIEEANFAADIRDGLTNEVNMTLDKALKNAEATANSNDPTAYVDLHGEKDRLAKQIKDLRSKIENTSLRLAKEEEERRRKAEEENVAPLPVSPDTPEVVKPDPKPVQKPKITKSYDAHEILADRSWHITSEADIDRYVEELRNELKAKLKDIDILNVDF